MRGGSLTRTFVCKDGLINPLRAQCGQMWHESGCHDYLRRVCCDYECLAGASDFTNLVPTRVANLSDSARAGASKHDDSHSHPYDAGNQFTADQIVNDCERNAIGVEGDGDIGDQLEVGE